MSQNNLTQHVDTMLYTEYRKRNHDAWLSMKTSTYPNYTLELSLQLSQADLANLQCILWQQLR